MGYLDLEFLRDGLEGGGAEETLRDPEEVRGGRGKARAHRLAHNEPCYGENWLAVHARARGAGGGERDHTGAQGAVGEAEHRRLTDPFP